MERIIRFFRIVDENHEPFPNEIPFDDFQGEIDGLPDTEAYVQLSRMEVLGSTWKPRRGAGARAAVPLVALDRITRDPQLRIERRRQYRPLALGNGETLADPSFYSIFSGNVLAVMRTSALSPGPATFRDYVNSLEIIKPGLAVLPLTDRNAVRALSEVGTLTKITVGVGPDASPDAFAGSQLIYDAIRAARRDLGGVAVELTVKIASKGQAAAAEEAHRQLAELVTTDSLEYLEKAAMTYRRLEDGRAATHDFLEEVITQTAAVDQDVERGQPAETSVGEALAAAYSAQYEDIQSALHAAS